ncbi:MAG TPA: hypothetical protein VLE89_06640 [Chlamydiales bacterium]|nr:hypothetical protein [Chlamydiales bacterium]
MKRLFFILLAAAAGCHHSSEPEDSLVAIQIQDRNGLTETISAPDRLEVYESVDFLYSQPYKKVLRVYRTTGKNHSKITTYHPNGTVWQYLEAEEMRAHGAYKEWFPNGQQKIEAVVIGGTADVNLGYQHDWLFEGEAQVWDEQGHPMAKIPYRNGALEGHSIYFYPNGQMERELPYSANLLQGDGFEYYPDGNLKSKTSYKKGLKEGPSLGFFSERQAAWIEDYSEGLLKTGAYYHPNGELYSEIENGGGFQALFDRETLSTVVEFRQGRAEGTVRKFSPAGELRTLFHLKNGIKHGEEIEYFLTSERSDHETAQQPKLSVNWHENVIHGPVKTWYNNGQLQSQREYCRNQKSGPAINWYRDGSLMALEEYEEDRLMKGQYYKKNQRDLVSSISNGNGIAFLYDGDGVFLRKVTYLKGKTVDPED